MNDRYSEDPELITPLIVSHLIPVLGGLYEYLKFNDSHPEMSEIFKFGAFGTPIGLTVGFILSTVNLSSYWVLITVLFGVAFVIKKLFLRENKYADFIWISYTGLFGFVYAYYFKYKQDHGKRYLIYHFTFRTLAYAIMIGLILGVIAIMVSGILAY